MATAGILSRAKRQESFALQRRAAVTVYCQISRSRKQIQEYLALSDKNYFLETVLRPLLNETALRAFRDLTEAEVAVLAQQRVKQENILRRHRDDPEADAAREQRAALTEAIAGPSSWSKLSPAVCRRWNRTLPCMSSTSPGRSSAETQAHDNTKPACRAGRMTRPANRQFYGGFFMSYNLTLHDPYTGEILPADDAEHHLPLHGVL